MNRAVDSKTNPFKVFAPLLISFLRVQIGRSMGMTCLRIKSLNHVFPVSGPVSFTQTKPEGGNVTPFFRAVARKMSGCSQA